MAHAVQLHTAGGDLLHIQVGVDDVLLVPDGDGGLVAEGVDDAAAPRQAMSGRAAISAVPLTVWG